MICYRKECCTWNCILICPTLLHLLLLTPLLPQPPPPPSPRSCAPHEQEVLAFITIDPEPAQILSEILSLNKYSVNVASPCPGRSERGVFLQGCSLTPVAAHLYTPHHCSSMEPPSSPAPSIQRAASHELSCCFSPFHLSSLPPFTSHDLRMVRISSLHWDIKGALGHRKPSGHQFLCQLCSPSSSRGALSLLAAAKPRFPLCRQENSLR